jgi:hypothetical protein
MLGFQIHCHCFAGNPKRNKDNKKVEQIRQQKPIVSKCMHDSIETFVPNKNQLSDQTKHEHLKGVTVFERMLWSA